MWNAKAYSCIQRCYVCPHDEAGNVVQGDVLVSDTRNALLVADQVAEPQRTNAVSHVVAQQS